MNDRAAVVSIRAEPTPMGRSTDVGSLPLRNPVRPDGIRMGVIGSLRVTISPCSPRTQETLGLVRCCLRVVPSSFLAV